MLAPGRGGRWLRARAFPRCGVWARPCLPLCAVLRTPLRPRRGWGSGRQPGTVPDSVSAPKWQLCV